MARHIDPRAPRFAQGVVGALALLAFVLDARLLLPVLAGLLLSGALLGPASNPLLLAWRHVVVPLARVAPPARLKDAAPVRFAQLVGAAFLVAASVIAYAAPAALAWAWGLTLVVSALALLAAVTDVCVGCEVYVRLRTWAARPGSA